MATWQQGDVVVDYITIVDGTGAGIVGASWTTVDTFDPDGADFTVSVAEIGGGVYKVQFTAVKAGHYYWSIVTTNLDPDQGYESDFDVLAADGGSTGVVTSQATGGTSLSNLIRMLAVRLGDFRQIKATQNGAVDGTSFSDSLRLAAIPERGMSGANLLFVSPSESANFMQESRAIEFSAQTQTLTLQPSLPAQVVQGDIAWLTNLYSEGYQINQYVDAINNAILRSYPNHLVPLTYSPATAWDTAAPWITPPTSVKKVYGIQVYEPGNEAQAIMLPFSPQGHSYLPGWWIDYANHRIVVNEPYRSRLTGQSIRVYGYGRAATLVNFSDVTTVDAEWLVDMGFEELKFAKGDQRLLAAASMGRNIADMNRGKMATIAMPGTVDIGN